MADLYLPCDTKLITEGFGRAAWRISKSNPTGLHDGVDFGIPQGTEIRATVSGIVRNNDAGTADGAGVDITTGDGWKVRHWHVSKFLLSNGSRVNAGDVIALSGGAKGTWGAGFSTGAHLHWGVAIDGRNKWVDPLTLAPKPFGSTNSIGKDMYVVQSTDGRGWLVTSNKLAWVQDPGEFDTLKRICGSNPNDPAMFISNQLDAVSKYFYGATVEVDGQAIASDVVASLKGININVEVLAEAIANKINCSSNSLNVTTKEEILAAIEANYPEEAS